MIVKAFARSELQKRLQITKLKPNYGRAAASDPISFRWTQAFLDALDTAHLKTRKVHTAFENAIHNTHNLDTVREQLAHIPVSLRYTKYHKFKGSNPYKRTVVAVIDDNQRCLDVDTPDCPNSVFPTNTKLFHKSVTAGDTVWCHFPVTLAIQNGFEIVRTWHQNDSLVDWLTAFLKLDDTEASIRIEELYETEDIRYTLYFPTATPTKQVDTAIQPEPTPEQLYTFIYKYAPVRTGTIKKFNNIEQSKLYRILKRLENDNRIEKIRQGVFIPKILELAKLAEMTLTPLKK